MTTATIRNRKGFSLLELIVVLLVIGVIAAIAIPTYNAVIGNSRETTALTTAQGIARNIQATASSSNPAQTAINTAWASGTGAVAIAVGETNATTNFTAAATAPTTPEIEVTPQGSTEKACIMVSSNPTSPVETATTAPTASSATETVVYNC